MSEKNGDKVIVDLPGPFVDERGFIQVLLDLPVASVLAIHCKKGAVRANHYHKEDFHYCYLASGSMEYYWRPAGSAEKPKMLKIHAGQLFYSPPMVEHAMKFLEDSIFYAFSKLSRKQENYEADVVRIKLI